MPSADSDTDTASPEAVSLLHSKKSLQQQNARVRKAQALARQKTRPRNREKDLKLKARSARNKEDEVSLKKGKGKQISGEVVEDRGGVEGGGGVDKVEARMLRAMMDAEAEGGLDIDADNEDEFAEFQEGSSFDGIYIGSAAESAESSNEDEVGSDEDEDMESHQDDEENTKPPSQPEKPKKSSNYLPDELFKAAFTQPSKPEPKKETHAKKQQKQKKRKPASTQKDIIIGSKAIRTLESSTTKPISSKAAVPSSKITKFLNRSLLLKGQRPIPGKGWERRPANIGVLRRNGPAAHFVRKSLAPSVVQPHGLGPVIS